MPIGVQTTRILDFDWPTIGNIDGALTPNDETHKKVTSNLPIDQIKPMLTKPKTKFATTNESQHKTVAELKNGAMKVNEAEASGECPYKKWEPSTSSQVVAKR